MIEYLNNFYEHYKFEIHEGLLFSAFVMFGAIVKLIRAAQKGSKLSFSWFLAEAILSFFIAILVYAVFDQFLHFKPFFVYTICAYCGSLSGTVNRKLEELVESFFDGLKVTIKDIFAALVEKIKSK